MAIGYLAQPGTEYGPCAEECDHQRCADQRAELATICPYCDEPIGDRGFFNFPPLDGPTWNGDLRHAVCYREVIEAERASS